MKRDEGTAAMTEWQSPWTEEEEPQEGCEGDNRGKETCQIVESVDQMFDLMLWDVRDHNSPTTVSQLVPLLLISFFTGIKRRSTRPRTVQYI